MPFRWITVSCNNDPFVDVKLDTNESLRVFFFFFKVGFTLNKVF